MDKDLTFLTVNATLAPIRIALLALSQLVSAALKDIMRKMDKLALLAQINAKHVMRLAAVSA